ncbi:MAG: amylo-alpha-1,6-glucosidase [Ignavibacteria bacterium]|nr:amylo-alpha-1,6-glucosidase [Ignavibacteria bacterium]
MPNRILITASIASLLLFLLAGCGSPPIDKPITVDELAIEVKGPSREVSFTNKQAGFFYTETNGEHRSSWQGWNVMAKEILEDYQIVDGGTILRKSDVTRATVYPHQLTRIYRSGAQETLVLLDSVNAFLVRLDNLKGTNLGVRLLFRDSNRPEDHVVKFRNGVLLVAHRRHLKRTPEENYPVWIGASIGPDSDASQLVHESDTSGASFSPAGIALPSSAKAATITFVTGDTEEETVALMQSVSKNHEMYLAPRRRRMENLLNRSFVRTDNQRFDKAFHWALLSMDALVMNQTRKGIFAGLPWFNNYWGRDSFIALPGATLVTGDFPEAREILRSFAEWQEQNPRSPNYGRIPNLVTTGSMAYNTTDGTPRFVVALEKYFRYSNDTAFVGALYPVVRRSIEGTLMYHVDQYGFLKHGDAETWMDAVGPAGPWSPRGDRANDIQALWFHQLTSSATLAGLLNDKQNAQLWGKIATAVQANFNRFFIDSTGTTLVDHLNPDGTQDHQARPNQLFALDILDNQSTKARLFKTITERLVYRHGVASLSQDDNNFHPYHHYEPFYVQDAAYHNGIVWTWLAGAWIDAATSYRLSDLAFTVTNTMVDQMLDRGAVGTISELLDAAPRRSETEPRLSGTFSQAWSLAEFVRVFYQDYLGIRVDAPGKRLTLSPRLPNSMHETRSMIAVGHAQVSVKYDVSKDRVVATLLSGNTPDSLTVTLDGILNGVGHEISIPLPPGRPLKIILSQKGSEWILNGETHKVEPTKLPEQMLQVKLDEIKLATPIVRPDLKSLKGPSHRLLSNAEVKAENTLAAILLDVEDPEGDDKGSGSYVYPLTPLLKPGSLDITRSTVSADDKNVYFKLRFRDLSNPGWHPEYGFQLTYVVIAIDKDNKPGSGQTAVGMNSNFSIDPRVAYETIIYVGAGVRISDSRGAVLAEYIPITGDEKNPLGDTRQKVIAFSVPLDVLGKPSTTWRYTVVVGCQDDHGGAGLGDFRTVETTAKEWTGGGRKKPADSNVYDVINPFNRK